MKLSKRQLKRIIREEKQKLQELDFSSGPPQGSDTSAMLEEAVLAVYNQLTGMDVGYSRREAIETILSNVQEVLSSIE